MTYFKSLLFNFLAVFFVNHILPGIQITYYTKIPHIEGDLIFAFFLGFINSLIFPVMKLFNFSLTHFKIGLVSFAIAFIAYSIVNLLPLGIKVTSAEGFIWAGLIVWFASYLTNHLEFRKYLHEQERKEKEEKKSDEDQNS